MTTPTSRSNLRRLLALPLHDQRLLCEAWWRLVAAAVRLRLRPARAIALALVEPGAEWADAGHSELPEPPESLALAVGRAGAHHLLPMTCLPRALALQRMLRRRGYSAVVRIGVRKVAGGVSAHAWVEVGGCALGEPEAIAERFLPLLPGG
ncbi:MAG: lasso peptide biosynthesis B2 protein [Thermoanaerobaculia bacterium]